MEANLEYPNAGNHATRRLHEDTSLIPNDSMLKKIEELSNFGWKKFVVNFELELKENKSAAECFKDAFGTKFASVIFNNDENLPVKSRVTLRIQNIQDYQTFFSAGNEGFLRIFDVIAIRPLNNSCLERIIEVLKTQPDEKVGFQMMSLSLHDGIYRRNLAISDELNLTFEQARFLKRKKLFAELIYSDQMLIDDRHTIFATEIIERMGHKYLIFGHACQLITKHKQKPPSPSDLIKIALRLGFKKKYAMNLLSSNVESLLDQSARRKRKLEKIFISS